MAKKKRKGRDKKHKASRSAQGKQRQDRRDGWATSRRQVIKVPEGAVLRGCKKTRRKLREHLRLRAEIHSQLRFIASLFVLRIFLTCLVGYPTPGSPSAPQPPAVQPPQPPDAPPLPPLPSRAPAQPAPAQPASMECDTDSDCESDCDSDPEPQSDSESESESEPEPVAQPPQRRCSARLAAMAPAAPTGPPLPLDCEDPLMLRQLKYFCMFFANPNFKTCYNQLQRRLVRNRHPMLMPAFEDPSNQALVAKLQELGSINFKGRIVKLYAKAARAKLGWSGEEAQLFIRMACGYGINAHSSELKAATLDKGHVADLIEEANKHRRLLGMKKEGSLQDTLPLPCRMRHAVHWARQRLRLYGAQDRALEQFFNKLEREMAQLSMNRHGRAKQLVVFFGAATIGTAGGWGADAVLRACRKVVCRPRGTDQLRGRVVLVDEHRTSRVSSAVNGQQPCEVELDKLSATRPAGWKPQAGLVDPRLVRPAWSQQRDQPVRGMMWCPVVAPRKPPQAPRSSQAATQPAASQPGPSTPPPAKRSKPAAEPTKGKGKGKAAKAKPAPQPGRWLDRDCNAALNMQRIGESKWRPLELCYWPDQGALPAKGKEYPGLGYKRVRDKPPKAQEQQQQPAMIGGQDLQLNPQPPAAKGCLLAPSVSVLVARPSKEYLGMSFKKL
ncbi:hypothetical protein QJQ45_011364 [Haematococcus lacustris]|nr:hypothetical protein QJQ45_011364 [Haematococcus lacustris]